MRSLSGSSRAASSHSDTDSPTLPRLYGTMLRTWCTPAARGQAAAALSIAASPSCACRGGAGPRRARVGVGLAGIQPRGPRKRGKRPPMPAHPEQRASAPCAGRDAARVEPQRLVVRLQGLGGAAFLFPHAAESDPRIRIQRVEPGRLAERLAASARLPIFVHAIARPVWAATLPGSAAASDSITISILSAGRLRLGPTPNVMCRRGLRPPSLPSPFPAPPAARAGSDAADLCGAGRGAGGRAAVLRGRTIGACGTSAQCGNGLRGRAGGLAGPPAGGRAAAWRAVCSKAHLRRCGAGRIPGPRAHPALCEPLLRPPPPLPVSPPVGRTGALRIRCPRLPGDCSYYGGARRAEGMDRAAGMLIGALVAALAPLASLVVAELWLDLAWWAAAVLAVASVAAALFFVLPAAIAYSIARWQLKRRGARKGASRSGASAAGRKGDRKGPEDS